MEDVKLIESKNGVELCKCNKCDTVLIDNNPQIGAKKYTLPSNAQEMEFIQDEGGYAHVCPICKTDAYLSDL